MMLHHYMEEGPEHYHINTCHVLDAALVCLYSAWESEKCHILNSPQFITLEYLKFIILEYLNSII